ncbi:carbohydrate kinase [Flavobacterium akiainvivens]|uniref:Carbohydrate kinase n=1 Tax=Flavobacterium akiainvivens TaxID=1202724 RepID=A0A0M8M8C3_9FLAO|nr:FGGY family carbohydrate kinase [Flavobacterium akiainvivens]KOS05623.1 carbohydrate kinase [Flavobacterium akiainvivens]SFQ35564.1 Sugar (pentulose or hexulose) kinase [Flavobacterium akiainvivens]
MTRVNAVFDIGKTNKKFFLFDEEYREVFREYTRLPETADEDGYPTEDLELLRKWIKDTFDAALAKTEFNIHTVNFSSYGASLVHLDYKGQPLTPLYNYTKDFDPETAAAFYAKYGGEMAIAKETASPQAGFLNSGLQLYWLKERKPEIFSKIKYSLHLPQYLSYLFTGIPVSEYTSIGCHTNLWDYDREDYHRWVYAEGIDRILPPIVPTSASINTTYQDHKLKIGVGIHDSSSALLPYILSKKKPFLLLSTGTWSIALNPYSTESLTEKDIEDNCLNYLRIDGKRVKASRFFMGNEYRLQVEKLSEYFGKEYGYHHDITFDADIYLKRVKDPAVYFEFGGVLQKQEVEAGLTAFGSFEEAYHQLMIELMNQQISVITNAIGDSDIKTIYIDGGFTDNDVFMKLMSHHFSSFKVLSTQSPLGSALGAAMVISDKKVTNKFLKENYAMKKLVPLFFDV